MIHALTINRFKSIRSLRIDCGKVNLFIGSPDTGKTNILEALCFLSRLGWGLPIDASLRLTSELGFGALFYRQFFDRPFEIALAQAPSAQSGRILSVRGTLVGPYRRLEIEPPPPAEKFVLDFGQPHQISGFDWIRYYAYKTAACWTYTVDGQHGQNVVTPPHGANLLYIARHHEGAYDFLKELLAGHNWRAHFDDVHSTLRLAEVRTDEIVDYNLELLSDTLKRLFFYGTVLRTTGDATLVMDEPDVFAFPPYPKALGEMIAADTSNQFFLTTHNPYLLAAIAEKTPADSLALFVCSRDTEGATTARRLSSDEVSRVIEHGSSVFFSLEDFLGQ